MEREARDQAHSVVLSDESITCTQTHCACCNRLKLLAAYNDECEQRVALLLVAEH